MFWESPIYKLSIALLDIPTVSTKLGKPVPARVWLALRCRGEQGTSYNPRDR